MRGTNGIPLGCSLLLPVGSVNSVKTLKVGGDPAACGDVSKIENEYGGYFQLTYAAFHCHAPACIKGELYNADTGELICRNTAQYGTGLTPSDEKVRCSSLSSSHPLSNGMG
jgi:hypothetical protein